MSGDGTPRQGHQSPSGTPSHSSFASPSFPPSVAQAAAIGGGTGTPVSPSVSSSASSSIPHAFHSPLHAQAFSNQLVQHALGSSSSSAHASPHSAPSISRNHSSASPSLHSAASPSGLSTGSGPRQLSNMEVEAAIQQATLGAVAATSPRPGSANVGHRSPYSAPRSPFGTQDGPGGPKDTRTQLFVGNLPFRVRWQDLKDLFRKSGTVLRADVALGYDNRSKGHGTVLLANEDDARKAIDMYHNYTWQGRTLEVRIDRSGLDIDGNPIPNMYPSSQTSLPGSSGFSLATMAAAGPDQGVMWQPPMPHPQVSTGQASQRSAFSPNVAPAMPGSNLNARLPGGSPALSTPSSMTHGAQAQTLADHRVTGFGGSLSPPVLPSGTPFLSQEPTQANTTPTAIQASMAGLSFLQAPQPSQQHTPQLQAQSAFVQTVPYPSAVAALSGQMALGGSTDPSDRRSSSTTLPNPQLPPHLASLGVAAAAAAAGLSPGANLRSIQAPQNYAGRVLFVGNLPFYCQWQDLKDLFRAAGNIQRADVALGQDGRSRGFGTVLFATPEDAQNAVRMYHGYEYNGRTLKVHFDKFAQMPMAPTAPSNVQYSTPAPTGYSTGPLSPVLAPSSQAQIYFPNNMPPSAPAQQLQFAQLVGTSGESVPRNLVPTGPLTSAAMPASSIHVAQGTSGAMRSQMDLTPMQFVMPLPSPSLSGPQPLPSPLPATTVHGTHPAHPGHIALPPAAFPGAMPGSLSPMQSRVPMTPSMPGFTFHPYPQTPPLYPQFLSPGLGPLSPALGSPPLFGPGATMINPAPGAPVHMAPPQTPQHAPGFNPLFPAYGANSGPYVGLGQVASQMQGGGGGGVSAHRNTSHGQAEGQASRLAASTSAVSESSSVDTAGGGGQDGYPFPLVVTNSSTSVLKTSQASSAVVSPEGSAGAAGTDATTNATSTGSAEPPTSSSQSSAAGSKVTSPITLPPGVSPPASLAGIAAGADSGVATAALTSAIAKMSIAGTALAGQSAKRSQSMSAERSAASVMARLRSSESAGNASEQTIASPESSKSARGGAIFSLSQASSHVSAIASAVSSSALDLGSNAVDLHSSPSEVTRPASSQKTARVDSDFYIPVMPPTPGANPPPQPSMGLLRQSSADAYPFGKTVGGLDVEHPSNANIARPGSAGGGGGMSTNGHLLGVGPEGGNGRDAERRASFGADEMGGRRSGFFGV